MWKQFSSRALITFALIFGFQMHCMAQERGTKDEAAEMLRAGMAHVKKVGTEQALKDFQADKATWSKKDIYMFAYNFKGVCLALTVNDKMVGKDLIDLQDPNGKHVVKEMIATAQSKTGSGWVDYDYANPVTKKVASKRSLIEKLPGFDGLIGVGYYQ
jgi:cytochrome c